MKPISLRPLRASDRTSALAIINAAAEAYRGHIPPASWHEPYFSGAHFDDEVAAGVRFVVAEDGAEVVGVMGLQDRGDVALIRHAYVSPAAQRGGIGSALLARALAESSKPVLIGTWRAATWAIAFYRRNGFTLLEDAAARRALATYWTIPDDQAAASVVLADAAWIASGR